ncbi:MAG: NUDIX domain-containing protein [Candidatus Neptunochlamydia sp.]|nr:NUDIX domain-containing protein [Candidatus Neptunochlamydia sp.]
MSNQDKIHVLSRAVIIDRNKILLCKTLDLDVSFYFLPGGHIEHGESAENSLLRELKEETSADCKIKRFLGCLEYSFEPGHNSICHNHEYNFIFEAESEYLTSDRKITCPEKHIELVWMPTSSLQEIDFRAEPLRKLLPLWLTGNSDNKFMSKMI